MTETGRGDVRTCHTARILRVIFGVALLGGMATATLADEVAPAPVSAGTKEEPSADPIKKEVQGPAMSAPREILQMLEQRKRALDKRETALRGSEMHLLELKAELEQIVTRHEQAVEAEKKRRQAAQSKANSDAEKPKATTKPGGAANVNQTQLAKIYETMPAEEAAARLERMPDRKAIEVLRLIKGKSAGAILAEVKPERAARLTEQLLTAP